MVLKTSILVAALLLAGASFARADPPSPNVARPAANASRGTGDLNFDLFDDQPRNSADRALQMATQARLDHRVHLRRKMLEWHQGLGFATLALLAATVVLGQLEYLDKYGGGNDTGNYQVAHLTLAVASTTTFTATGLLALLAPNPYPKPLKLDAALVHKASMAAATACFLAEIVLGTVTYYREGKLDQRDLALAHLVAGYGAFGFMTAGTLAYVF